MTRVQRLDIERYGCFTDQVLDLSGPGVQLVIGPNEAGKSTIRSAFAELLYGIEERTTLDFVHQKSDLRIGARLLDRRGQSLEIVRYKRHKNPVTDDTGSAIEESRLASLLAGVTRSEFVESFAIDHEELRRGGKGLLDGNGDLSRALFESQSGLRLSGLLRRLDDQLGALYKVRGQKIQLNQHLKDHAAARSVLRDAALRPESYQEKESAVAAARKHRDRLTEGLERLRKEEARLSRIRQALPGLIKHAELTGQRQALMAAGRTIRLGAGERLASLEVRIRRAADAAGNAASRRDGHLARLDEPHFQLDENLLAQADTVEELHADVRSVRDAEQMAMVDRSKAAEARRKADSLVPIVPPAVLEAGSSQALIDRVERLRADKATLDVQALDAEQNQCKRLEAVRKTKVRVEETTGASPEAAEIRALVKAVPVVLADRIRDQRKRIAALEAKADAVRLRHSLAAGVDDRALPATEQVTGYRTAFDDSAAEAKRLELVIRESGDKLDVLRRDLEEILLGDPPPTEIELEDARRHREDLWTRIRMSLSDHSASAGGTGDFVRYEQAVVDADRKVDRIRRDAEASARRVRLDIDIAAEERLLSQLQEQRSERESFDARLAERWEALWAPSMLPAPEPSAAAALLAAIGELREQADSLREVRVELVQDLAEAERLIARFRGLLAPGTLAEDADLAEALAAGKDCLERGDAAERKREKNQTALGTASDELSAAEDELSRYRERQNAWTAEWNDLLAEHHLAGEPVAVLETLATVSTIEHHQAEADGFDLSANAAEERVRVFAERLATTLVACGLPAETDDRFGEATRLHDRLDEQRQCRTERLSLAQQATDAAQEHDDAKAEHAEATRELAALLGEHAVADAVALREAVERSERVRALDSQIEVCEDGLRGTGRSMAALRTEAVDWESDPDRLEAELAQTRDERVGIEAEHTEKVRELAHLERELESMDGSARAALASEHAAEALATVVEESEEYLRLHLARELLLECMEEYREANQSPVLNRAEVIFRELTGGRFSRFITDVSDKGAILFRGRRDSGADVEVAAMSEGTRDQLYFALRLASLERYAEAERAMPILLDDVFMTSDEQRTAAGLRVLDEVAERFQVVVLTHHKHLVEAAARMLPEGRVHVHELSVFVPIQRAEVSP